MTDTTEQSNFQRILAELRRHGPLRTLYKLMFKAINCIVVFKVLRGVSVERAEGNQHFHMTDERGRGLGGGFAVVEPGDGFGLC